MTGQHLAWLLLGVASGVASGYPWGRWNGRRALDREYDAGYDAGREDGYADALDDLDAWPKGDEGVMPNDPGRNAQGRPGPLVAPGAPLSLAGGAPGLDWRERTAIELAPETLQGSAALQLDEGPRRDVPRPPAHAAEKSGSLEAYAQGPGHPQSAEWSATILAAFYGGGDGLPSLVDVNAGWDAHMAGFERDVRRVDAEITRWAEWARESLTPAWLRAARILEVA